MTNRRYRLLKNIYASTASKPILETGFVLKFMEEFGGYMCSGVAAIFSKDQVENSPETFELIPEASLSEPVRFSVSDEELKRLKDVQQSWSDVVVALNRLGLEDYKWDLPITPVNRILNFLNDKFSAPPAKEGTWSDEDMMDFAKFNSMCLYRGAYKKNIQSFKFSKQSQPTIHHGEDNLQYISSQPETGCPTIDRQEEKKDWEIVETSNKVDGVHHYVKNGCEDFKCETHSVRRLTDNQVLSVNEEYFYCGIKVKVKKFEIFTGAMCAVIENVNDGVKGIAPIGELKKQPSPSSTERVEISRVWGHDTLRGNNWDSFWYQFCSSKIIPDTKFQSIKNAIEQVLNNETNEDFWKQAQAFCDKEMDKYAGAKYTQPQLEEAIRKSFDAGRAGLAQFSKDIFSYDYVEDYLKTIK